MNGAMGAKGPIVIFVIGCLGLAGMGIMANMVAKNPRAKSILSVRAALAEHYPASKVLVKPRANRMSVKFFVDKERFRPGESQELPPEFHDLASFFHEHYDGKRTPHELRVEFLDASGVSLEKHQVDLRRDTPEVTKLKRLFGAKTSVTKRKGRVLLIHTSRDLDPKTRDEGAQLIKNHLHGEWTGIRINAAGKTYRYNGQGKPISR